MPHFYEPDLGSEPDSPFARDANNKLVRRGYWLDMNDRSLVLVMTQGIGAHLTTDEKRARLTDLTKTRPPHRSGLYSRDFAARRRLEHRTIQYRGPALLSPSLPSGLDRSDCMTIHRLIQNLAFNQDDIERLAAAYEEALRALHISDRDDPVNEVIARRIVEGARAGVRDTDALCQMAIKDLMVP